MSRYGGDFQGPPPPRSNAGFGRPPPSNVGGFREAPPPSHAGGFREEPPAPRWDSERFVREREERVRGPAVLERERPYEGYGRRMEERFERKPERVEERFFAEERYGPPARRPERRYYEEDDFYERTGPRSPPGGAMVPFRRPAEAPPRPGIIRRQSSLDTFDRRPSRRYEEIDEYRREEFRAPPPPPPPVIPVPLPSKRPMPPPFVEREYEDVRVSEPEYYGDEEYRAYREREWTTRRRRRSDSSEESEEEEATREKPFPRKGKTRMPRRLVHTRAIIELGYPYEEEGETIIILKALGKENIDEVVSLSKRYKEEPTQIRTIHTIESGPGPEIREEKFIEKVETKTLSEAPRSVREWDQLRVERSPSPSAQSRTSHRSRRSHSRHNSHARRQSSPGFREEIFEKKDFREVSPSAKSGRTRRRSSPRGTEIIERREIVEEDLNESDSIHAGPLALVLPERHRKSERDIAAEIRALEAERKALKYERQVEKEHRKADRYREGSTELIVRGDREMIVERPAEEVVEVKKDRKAPNPKLVRALLATLT